jgi:hypothetical protein
MENKRNPNFELLRIISMWMIIVLHMLGHGKIINRFENNNMKYYFCWFLEATCYTSVNCYVLIAGYFLCKKTKFLKNIISTWLIVFFYSISLFLFSLFFIGNPFKISNFIISIFPILSREYWFASVYIGLLILAPYINSAYLKLSLKSFKQLIVICIVLFSLWPVCFPFSSALNSGGGEGIVWFVTLYLIAVCIRSSTTIKLPIHILIMGTIFSTVFLFITKLLINDTTLYIFGESIGSGLFYQYNSPIVLIASIMFFLIFVKTKINANSRFTKFIKLISNSTFGTYLIHDNPFVKDWIWSKLNYHYIDSEITLIPYIVGVSAIVFICCIIVDIVRRRLFVLFKIDDIADRILEKFIVD